MVLKSAVAQASITGAMSDLPLIAAAVVLVLVLSLVRASTRRRRRRPARGEVWFAQVPFGDGTGSKDRPVLVLSVDRRTCTVAGFTSRDRSARGDHRRVPDGLRGLQRSSWVNLRPVMLSRTSLRRRVSRPDAALVLWYARESGWSAAA